MRSVGFLLAVCLFWPFTPCKENLLVKKPADNIFQFHPHQKTPALLPSAAVNKNSIDTTQLKQSDWFAEVKRGIEESEYEIQPAGNNEYSAPNLQQNLVSAFSAAHFKLQPGNPDAGNWKLDLEIKGVYAGNRKLFSLEQNAEPSIEKNKISFYHGNDLTVEYINNEEGVRQNFIINKKPARSPGALQIKLQASRGWFVNRVHPHEIHFAKRKGNEWDKKIVYNDLKVWDATNKELEANFSVAGNEISININTLDAIYPVTVDPLSTSPNTSLPGGASGDYFGVSVASAGDVNGDGYSDVIVGAYGVSSNKGNVYLYQGSSTGLSGSPSVTISGSNPLDRFGISVSSAGDVNGDGYSDVIVGADNVSSGQGAAYLFLGSAIGLSTTPNASLNGSPTTNDRFGEAVACAGDVNSDGYSDVIIGAHGNPSNSFKGAAYIYLGSSTGLINSPSTVLNDINGINGDEFGWSVSSAGDVNGDGYSDVVVGAYGVSSAKGAAYIYLGSSTGLINSPSTVLNDINGINGDEFGWSVSSAGDVNGDGYSDVVVGAYGVSSAKGAAYIYLGSSTGLINSPSTVLNDINGINGDEFGWSVSCAGDINGDGYSDVIVGAPVVAPSSTGAVYLFLGSSTGITSTISQTLGGITSSSSFGYFVASGGDVNGDGYSDIIVGAPNTSTNTGAAYVYHGSADILNTTAGWTVYGNQTGASLGLHISAIASAGDVNGDGYSDVIIGIPYYDNGGLADEGRAYVFYGSGSGLSTSPNWTADGNQAGAYFGWCVSFAGDVNGDGYGDIIIGAPNYTNGGLTNEGRVYVYYGSASGLSSSPDWTTDSNQAGAKFGFSVATSGDIDGDGYGDIIIGAITYTHTVTNEGAAFVYNGSPTGLNTSPSWSAYSGQANSWFGHSVASAGDINGDGYSDAAVGALFYSTAGGSTQEGKVFVYYGSGAGLSASASWTAIGSVNGAGFGVRVASAGDVNGDGFGDFIVGAHTYSSGSILGGAAFVYYGSATGLPLSPNWTVGSTQTGSYFGIVSSAGDINGDGYSDVLIGSFAYNSWEGAAFVYKGSSSGLSTTPAWTITGTQANEEMGYSVACAGDVNGDGYSDILVGALGYTNTYTSEGAVFLYFGNMNRGLRNNLRLYNADTVTPINHASIYNPNLFGAGLYAKSFLGRQKGKMVWETEKNGIAFSGNPITNSVSYTLYQTDSSDLGLTGRELKSVIAKQSPSKATYIRARIKYDRATAITGQVYGPWRYPESFLRGIRDIGAVALPLKFISFTAIKQNENAILKWTTANEAPGTGYEVQRSNDGIHFAVMTTVAGNNLSLSDYQWTDTHVSKGKNYYRIRAVENTAESYSVTRMLDFEELTGLSIYPNPVSVQQTIIIRAKNIRTGQPVKIILVDQAGQKVWMEEIAATADDHVSMKIPELPAGIYHLRMQAQSLQAGETKIVIVK